MPSSFRWRVSRCGRGSVWCRVRRDVEGTDTGTGGASVSGDQVSVWLSDGAVQGIGEEGGAGDDLVCVIEPVDEATQLDGTGSVSVPERGAPPTKMEKTARNWPKSHQSREFLIISEK